MDPVHSVNCNSFAPEEAYQLDGPRFEGAGVIYSQDRSLDNWMSYVLDNKPAGKLNVDRLRRVDLHKDSWFNLVGALVIWHDVKATLIESEPDLHHSTRICEVVHEFEMRYKMTYLKFRGLKEPGDPLELSDEQFRHLYHVHNQANLPCYKRKRPSHLI
jgi:hypothetical protein